MLLLLLLPMMIMMMLMMVVLWVEAQGQSQVSGNSTTLTRALSAESLLSQTQIAITSPQFCRGQFHVHATFSLSSVTFYVDFNSEIFIRTSKTCLLLV